MPIDQSYLNADSCCHTVANCAGGGGGIGTCLSLAGKAWRGQGAGAGDWAALTLICCAKHSCGKYLRHLENISINWQINVNLILKNKHKNKSKQEENCLVMSQSQLEKLNSKNLQDFQLKNHPKQSINIQSWHPCCASLFICDPKLTLNCDRYMCIYAIDTIALYPVLSSTIPSCPADRQRTLLFIDFVFAFASLTI